MSAPVGRERREPTDSRRAPSLLQSLVQVQDELHLTPARCKQTDLKNTPLAKKAVIGAMLRKDEPEGGHDPAVGVEQASGHSVWSKAGDGRA